MFDTDTLRPIIIAMAIYITMAQFLPQIMKKPIGVKLIDESVMLLVSQKEFMASGAALIGLIVFLANYINLEMF